MKASGNYVYTAAAPSQAEEAFTGQEVASVREGASTTCGKMDDASTRECPCVYVEDTHALTQVK